VRIAGLLLVSLISGVALAQTIEVQNPWVSWLPTTTTAAYFTLVNQGDRPVRLLEVLCPLAKETMLMITTQTPETVNGQQEMALGMQMVPYFLIPPHGRLVLAPGGNHVMLMGLRSPLKLGERVKLILIFSDGSRMTIEAPVRRE